MQVYKGFDEKQGIDVAWSKVLKEHNQLTDEQMAAIVQEMKVGLDQVLSLHRINCASCLLHICNLRSCALVFIASYSAVFLGPSKLVFTGKLRSDVCGSGLSPLQTLDTTDG